MITTTDPSQTKTSNQDRTQGAVNRKVKAPTPTKGKAGSARAKVLAKPRKARKALGSSKPRKTADAWPETVRELKNLRSRLTETLEHVNVRLTSQLAQVLTTLENKAKGVQLPAEKVAQAALKKLRALRLKPDKGRVKDVVRMRNFLDKIEQWLSAGKY